VSYRGELVELAVVDRSIDSTQPWQKVLNAISNEVGMERALGYTPTMRTKPRGLAYLPDRPADGIMMFESDVSARRVLSLPPTDQVDDVMVVLFDGGDKDNTQGDRARTLIKQRLRPPPPWTGNKTPRFTQRQSVGAIIDLTDDNVQPSDSHALPKRSQADPPGDGIILQSVFNKAPRFIQRQSVGTIIDLTDANVQPSDSHALPKRPQANPPGGTLPPIKALEDNPNTNTQCVAKITTGIHDNPDACYAPTSPFMIECTVAASEEPSKATKSSVNATENRGGESPNVLNEWIGAS
jgi:hypothetical protein